MFSSRTGKKVFHHKVGGFLRKAITKKRNCSAYHIISQHRYIPNFLPIAAAGSISPKASALVD